MAVTEHDDVPDVPGTTAIVPPPPPPARAPAIELTAEPIVPRPGELSSAWRVVMVLGWVAVALAWSSVWSVAVQLGQSTWWLGTRASPTSPVIRLLPYVAPVIVTLGTILNVRRLAWVGIAGSVLLAGYGIGDLGDRMHLGLIEVAIAAAALLVSIAAFSGTYRAAPDTPDA